MPLIAWWLHLYTADERTMGAHLDVLVTHARLELDRTDDAIASTTLGDWVAPDASPGGGNPPEDSRVPATAFLHQKIGSAACRERVCQYVLISVGAVSFKKKNTRTINIQTRT